MARIDLDQGARPWPRSHPWPSKAVAGPLRYRITSERFEYPNDGHWNPAGPCRRGPTIFKDVDLLS